MPTHKTTWKRRERQASKFFGAQRQPLSGSSGRNDLSSSDSTHNEIYLEVKTRERHSARSLWEATNEKAKDEGKTPCLFLFDKDKVGGLIVCHESDFAFIAAQREHALAKELIFFPPIAKPTNQNRKSNHRTRKTS